ncbi:hypothetical protein ASPVEDRAFT_81122 [Aspergillus versicolor CBS 583.65]|uniref:Major facilitator superfamily (MFS) profile domain-containing protein n=1 Tax=Aspergillus versicolor CBS 583.65 TaxID=1036611 RepID=A0A1L9PDB9_ASPVE|nr:uncharacterized protein ASPVEDRAFT_81122 [Aspergillus versicolor CBS 583.65]OJI99509.1 hypothetical protein ASPVEDRAFT_81122 [Aspergillus versicolor CBS 583.65]
MFLGPMKNGVPWGHRWRSSDTFIVSTMSLAMFTDDLLFAFMIPLLPTILEDRIGLDPSLTQRYTSIFLTEGALVSIISSPFIGALSDAVSSKKLLLLGLLVLTLITTACLSLTVQLPWLFIGRFFQSITSNSLWIVGMATMVENLGSEHIGKIGGLVTTLQSTGTTAGPFLAGLLFEVGGYWCAWAAAGAFLLVDITMRLLMVEKSSGSPATVEDRVRDRLLQDDTSTLDSDQSDDRVSSDLRSWRFHAYMFRQSRFAAGIFCAFVFAVIIGSLESTISVHVRIAFGWRAFHIGILLAMLQGPGILLGSSVGWMKDRIGSRFPTAVGLLGMAPLITLLGIPGDKLFPWVEDAPWVKIAFMVCIAMMGCLLSLQSGLGSVEAADTINAIEEREPGKFGPHGGYARALAVINMTWMAGLMTGPVLGGLLVETAGYFVLHCCLGVLSFMAGCVALLFLRSVPYSSPEN